MICFKNGFSSGHRRNKINARVRARHDLEFMGFFAEQNFFYSAQKVSKRKFISDRF